ncbi:titin-like [Topomyia yanbarensis]|uniref:titin-like n=1 Tax=Topomyia yanbarensis TaxID=2498891 RepID=UPI00273CE314|nr:titin-like [Topomyia yanbarensis]
MDSSGVVAPPPPPSIGRIRAKHCDVRGCNADSLRNPELLFVGVPSHSYPERRFVWLTLMQSVRDKKRSYCCSRHFKIPDDYKDFNEFISAPPGYKRQLMVNRGVVPHLNMPPPMLSGLPPLTDRWQLTLPDSMRQSHSQSKQDEAAQQHSTGGTSPQRMMGTSLTPAGMRMGAGQAVGPSRATAAAYRGSKFCKAVQTELNPMVVSGPRRMQPSLQYCRLCFKRQNLEPIFTGDQTLIEPDLIDKIYGCTEVMITVETDFPSSICTECYGSVQDFNKFRKLVQQNNESLRAVATVFHRPAPVTIRTKTTEGNSSIRPVPNLTPMRSVMTNSRSTVSNVTPHRPQLSTPVQRPLIQRNIIEDDELLEVGRVEDVRTYQRRSMMLEKQMSRVRPLPQPRFPTPAQSKPVDADPLAAGGFGTLEAHPANTENALPSVQAKDRVVPVTLIRVMPEADDAGADVELNVSQPTDNQPKEEEPDTEPALKQNFLQPKPIEELTGNSGKKSDESNVLQAVKLIPASAVRSFTKARPSGTFLRPASSKGLNMPKILNLIRTGDRKKELKSNMVARAVKFPGTLTTLFTKPKKLYKPQKTIQTAVESSIPSNPPKVSKPVEIPKVPDVPTVLKEVKITEKPMEQQQPKVQINKTDQTKQKENDVPEAPKEASLPKPVTEISQPKLPIKKSERSKQKEINVSECPKEPSRPKSMAERPKQKEIKVPESLKEPPQSKTNAEPKLSAKKSEQPKQKENDDDSRKESPRPQSSLPQSKLPLKKSERPKQKENDIPESPKEASDVVLPVSPRSARTRKIPLKFQNTVGFPMPKMITIKQEKVDVIAEVPTTGSPQTRSSTGGPQVEKETSKSIQDEPPVRSRPATRRSDPTVISKAPTAKPTTDSKPKPAIKSDPVATKAPVKSKPQPPPRRTEAPPPEVRSLKRKSLPETKLASAPPSKKSPKLDTKRDSLGPASKAKQSQQQQQQRANGSRRSAPATISTAAKKTTVEDKSKPVSKEVSSSQDWKCPFCSDKVFDQKKGLVRHLRKRHGMDYALVRQRLAIYGGNWR